MRKSYDFFQIHLLLSFSLPLGGLVLHYVQLFQFLTFHFSKKKLNKKKLLKASLKCDVLLYSIVRELFQVVNIPSEVIALILIIWELLLSS